MSDLKVRQWEGAYQLAATTARESTLWRTEVEAALLAPANFLSRPDDFEFTFQLVIYHLKQAIRKANDEAALLLARRIADELINFYAHMIEQRIRMEKERNQRQFLTALADFFSGSTGKAAQAAAAIAMESLPDVAGISAEVREILRAFVEYFFLKWKLKEQSRFFSQQLASLLQRTLEEPLLQHDCELLTATFTRSKSHLLPAALQQHGLFWTLNLLRLDRTPMALQASLRVLVTEISASGGRQEIFTLFALPVMNSALDVRELEAVARAVHWARLKTAMQSETPVALFAGVGCLVPILALIAAKMTSSSQIGLVFFVVCALVVIAFPTGKALALAAWLRLRLRGLRRARLTPGHVVRVASE